MKTLDVINSNIRLQILALALLPLVILSAQGDDKDIVINEIMYHPPNDLEGEEFIELYNTGKTPVDLSGWKFTKGIRYTFPRGTIIEPDGYLVVCKMLDEFRATYGKGIVALGNFKGLLRNSRERVTLSLNATSMLKSSSTTLPSACVYQIGMVSGTTISLTMTSREVANGKSIPGTKTRRGAFMTRDHLQMTYTICH